MKVRVWLLVVAVALIPATVRAQEPAKDSTHAAQTVKKKKKPPMRIVRLSARDVNRAMPLLKDEIGMSTGMGTGVTSLSRSEYNRIKDALIIARLDYRDPSRLEGDDDGTFAIRRMNVDYFRVNESNLDMIVQRARPDRRCPLCAP